MVDEFGYASGMLRAGGALAGAAAEIADRVAVRWGARRIDPLDFGDVDGAADLGVELAATIQQMVDTAQGVADMHHSLDRRAHGVAGMGDQLEVDTAVIARGGTPDPDGPIVRAMR